ncbi:MAG TPA: hypothetical protein VF048_13700, partial [Gemmatimonadaceae bacterium]
DMAFSWDDVASETRCGVPCWARRRVAGTAAARVSCIHARRFASDAPLVVALVLSGPSIVVRNRGGPLHPEPPAVLRPARIVPG